MGRIGEAVARRLRAFGISRTLYWGRRKKPELHEPLQAEFSSFDRLVTESDYIVACCALTPDTKEIFDYQAFSKMKKDAVRASIEVGRQRGSFALLSNCLKRSLLILLVEELLSRMILVISANLSEKL